MRIFLTGATGYIGSAVLDAMIRAGHEVTGLVRSPEKAAWVESRGGRPRIGDLSDAASYRETGSSYDVFIHTAFENSPRGPEVDRTAIGHLVAAARAAGGSGSAPSRLLVYTSGVWVLGNTTDPATEEAPLNPTPIVSWRPAHEQLIIDAAGAGLRTAIVRPGIVYGGGRGIIGDLFKEAAYGLVRIIGNGDNRWAAIYDRDLADLYVRIVNRPDATGVFHASDDSDDRVNDIVSAICRHMTVAPEIRRMPIEEARAKLGGYASALALDQVVWSPRARALGWAPTIHSIARNTVRLMEEWRNAS
jgi:nucleoside-diphosphate-sugar epimerase